MLKLPNIIVLIAVAGAAAIVSPTSILAQSWPDPLGYAQLVYDSAARALILYGGQTNSSKIVNDTWVYSCVDKIWKRMSPAISPSIGEGPMAYDSKHDRAILFVTMNFFTAKVYSETWAYDLKANTWTKIDVPTSPTKGMMGARMVYNSNADRMVLFGGMYLSGRMFNDTWLFGYENSTWTLMTGTPRPKGRNFHQMTYDSDDDRVLLWGGETDNRMWSYDTSRNIWAEIASEGAPRLCLWWWS
jgi:hypothetical protein